MAQDGGVCGHEACLDVEGCVGVARETPLSRGGGGGGGGGGVWIHEGCGGVARETTLSRAGGSGVCTGGAFSLTVARLSL